MGLVADVLKVGAGILVADRLLRGYEQHLSVQIRAIEAIARDDEPVARLAPEPARSPSPNRLLGPVARPATPSGRWLFRLWLQLRNNGVRDH